jgi:hypothetical protein
MKYILAIATLLLFSTATSYARLYSRQTKTEESAVQRSSLYDHTRGSSYGNSDELFSGNTGGLFRSPADDDSLDPGDRPGTGEGIGQETPISDGLYLLIACCIFFALVETFRKKLRLVFQIKSDNQ